METQCIGILGGSFNPVHVGHLRLAIEVYEALSPQLEYIDFVPCAQPPHKNSTTLLPFALRAEIVRAAVAEIPFLRVNTIEAQRSGPSYTYDTLLAYGQHFPAASFMFLLGGEDFASIQQWHRGVELPQLTNIAVVPRAGTHSSSFCQTVNKIWPEAMLTPTATGGYQAQTQWGTQLLYLPLPRLDVSASLLRSRWIDNKRIDYLVPHKALDVLRAQRQQSIDIWSTPERTLTSFL